jgi:hypothetical protein
MAAAIAYGMICFGGRLGAFYCFCFVSLVPIPSGFTNYRFLLFLSYPFSFFLPTTIQYYSSDCHRDSPVFRYWRWAMARPTYRPRSVPLPPIRKLGINSRWGR